MNVIVDIFLQVVETGLQFISGFVVVFWEEFWGEGVVVWWGWRQLLLDFFSFLVNGVGEGGDLQEGVVAESLESLAYFLGQNLGVWVGFFFRVVCVGVGVGVGKGVEFFAQSVQVLLDACVQGFGFEREFLREYLYVAVEARRVGGGVRGYVAVQFLYVAFDVRYQAFGVGVEERFDAVGVVRYAVLQFLQQVSRFIYVFQQLGFGVFFDYA